MTRTVLHDAAEVPDDLLTTGEAAKLLNSSRQHVVNLCRRGVLPYTSIGTHRRIRRQDLEALRSRTGRLRREDRRSLWLAYATAGKIVSDPPTAVERARHQIALMRPTARGQARTARSEHRETRRSRTPPGSDERVAHLPVRFLIARALPAPRLIAGVGGRRARPAIARDRTVTA